LDFAILSKILGPRRRSSVNLFGKPNYSSISCITEFIAANLDLKLFGCFSQSALWV
jgi:hypothetical protein